jgi:phosphoadenosine phosphosulfate reductase
MNIQEQIDIWNKQLENETPQKVIAFFQNHFKSKIALASSLGFEDQVLTHLICANDKTTTIFTLDTGRVFPETYSLMSKTNDRYDINLKVYFPNFNDVEKMVNTNGVNLFYESIENRKLCCNIRKMEPLRRAFSGLDAWICGLRREQSVTRADMKLVEWDSSNNLVKINPLINWTEQQLWDYVRANAIPYNVLHDKGFPSIGCQPCTRAVKPGEDIRAGRWWWENPEQKECGLHAKK